MGLLNNQPQPLPQLRGLARASFFSTCKKDLLNNHSRTRL
jgi:hypothetical protein